VPTLLAGALSLPFPGLLLDQGVVWMLGTSLELDHTAITLDRHQAVLGRFRLFWSHLPISDTVLNTLLGMDDDFNLAMSAMTQGT
jgi:hypothetical protein